MNTQAVDWDNYTKDSMYLLTSPAVIIMNSAISGNTAQGGSGGGVENAPFSSAVRITNSTISGNTTHTNGGVFNRDKLYLNRSLISVTLMRMVAPSVERASWQCLRRWL